MPLLPTLVRFTAKRSLEGGKIVGGGVGRQPWQHLARREPGRPALAPPYERTS